MLKRKGVGKSGSTQITILPAPAGIGIVAGATAKKVLEMAGVIDCWTVTKGRTRNTLNMVRATINALESLNTLKKGKTFSEDVSTGAETAETAQPEPAKQEPEKQAEEAQKAS